MYELLMATLWPALFLFVIAALLAAIEIETEGKHGWAQDMPTWYRTEGLAARVYALIMGGRPLTGYHLFMFFFTILIFHLAFYLGLPITFSNELIILTAFFTFAPLWDFLWFVLNPFYGIMNFKKRFIWWHSTGHPWFLGLPRDYWMAWGLCLVLSLIQSALLGTIDPAIKQAYILFWLLIFTFTTIPLSPLYHMWYRHMRKMDHRDKVNFFYPPDKQ